MKSFLSSLGEVIKLTALRKHRAAQARFGKSVKGGASPSEITAEACKEIARNLEKDGFQYSKSKASCIKRTDDLSLEIHFQSDRNNVRGEHVGLWIHANVFSKRLKKWRIEQTGDLKKEGGLAGGQIGNLLPKKGWMEWELAEAHSRDQSVRDAISTIREIALPYFAQFDDPALFLRQICRSAVEELTIGNAIEYALCYGSPEQAQGVLSAFFVRRAELLPEYLAAIAEFRLKGLPVYQQTNYARAAAFATLAYGLTPAEKPSS